jgi:predicted nucleic acid-binding protein
LILVDANILIYAHVNSFAQHDAARFWLDRQLLGSVCPGRACSPFCGW